jgi:hypothetical protein
MPQASTITASGKTGATCSQSGPYRSPRNAKVTVFVKAGQRFPADTDGASTTWTLIKQ